MDRIQEMQFFIAVAQAGSFSAAARESGGSLSSMWRHVNALEDRLGTPLLRRTNRNVVLTESGKMFFDHAQEIVRHVTEMDEALTAATTEPQGRLLLHSNVSLSQRFVGPSLPNFLQRFPKVAVNLWATDGNPDLLENGIDLAIRVSPPADTTALIARKLGQIAFRCCASPAYLAGKPPIVVPADLLAHECLSYRFGDNPPVWGLTGPDGDHQVAVKGRLQSSIAEPLRLAAVQGMGVTVLPARLVRDDIKEGRLVPLLPDHVPRISGSDNGVYLLWRRERHTPAKMRAMIDHLVDVFRSYEELQSH